MALYQYLPHLTQEVEDQLQIPESNKEQEDRPNPYEISYRLGGRSAVEGIACMALSRSQIDLNNILEESGFNEKSIRSLTCHGTRASYNPWNRYIAPLLEYGPLIRRVRPDLMLQIFVDSSLDFLSDRLSEWFEVVVMAPHPDACRSASLWPLLSLEDHPGKFTYIETDCVPSLLDRVSLTDAIAADDLGLWRIPRDQETTGGEICYFPISGSSWGTTGRLPGSGLLSLFERALDSGLLSCHGTVPGDKRELPVMGSQPESGFSREFFLMTCVFPRLAHLGVLTLAPRKPISRFLLADVEFCLWQSEKSTVSYDLIDIFDEGREGRVLPRLLRELRSNRMPVPHYRTQVPP